MRSQGRGAPDTLCVSNDDDNMECVVAYCLHEYNVVITVNGNSSKENYFACASLPAYPAINRLGLFAVFSLDAWSSRKTKHSLTYRTLLVRVSDSAFHLNSSKLPPAPRKMRGRGTI